MKAKRKIDQKAIKQFFIDHTEKFVIGLVGLLFAYFAYQAFTIEHGPPHDPAFLQTATKTAVDHMQKGPTADGDKAPIKVEPINDYARKIDISKKPIALNTNADGTMTATYSKPEEGSEKPVDTTVAMLPKDWQGWYPRLIPPSRLRETPQVFAVEKLRAIPGRGALIDNQGGGNGAGNNGNNNVTRGQRWVCVTGLVPYGKQLAEHNNKYKDAANTDYITPRYGGFLVQRAEVVPGSQGEPAWENKYTYSNDAFTKPFAKWRGMSAEVIDPKFFKASLVSPLPPLAIGNWTDDVVHPSEIKMLPPQAQPANQAGGGGMGDRGGRPGVRDIAPGMGPPAIGDAGTSRQGSGGGDDTLTGEIKDKPKDEIQKPEAEEVSDCLLLRYFDFDVEPGKQYAYRVFLILQNPNFGLTDAVVADPAMTSIKFLGVDMKSAKFDEKRNLIWIDIDQHIAKWSEQCVSTTLPGDMRLLAGQTFPPKVSPAPQEVTGEFRVLRYDDKSGLNTNFQSEDPQQYRGKHIIFDNVEMKPNRTKVPELDTQCILVDLAGGEPLNPKDRDRSISNLDGGAHILLDANGNLVIHDEMGDLKEWTDNTKEPEKPKEVNGRVPGTPDIRRRGPDSGGPDIDTHRRGGR